MRRRVTSPASGAASAPRYSAIRKTTGGLTPPRSPGLTVRREGLAVVWLVLMLPLLFLMLCFVVEIGNLWLARAELETALESSALAAVKEWGDAGGASGTLTSRQVGQTVAAANFVRGTSVVIGTNYIAATAGNPNGNLDGTFPTANLVFGALTSTSPTVVFTSGVAPSCSASSGTSAGTVLLDASAQNNLQDDNAWGINFQPPVATTTPGLTLSRVVLDLRAGGDVDAAFDLLVTAPRISDNVPNRIASQNDVFGISNAALTLTTVGTVRTWANSQVRFVWNSTIPHILTITFLPSGTDSGLAPGDRLRFGARVINLPQNDGDGVGRIFSTATLTYAVSGINQTPDLLVSFVDTRYSGSNPPPLDPDVLPNSAPYLLPNGANAVGNDRQSAVESIGVSTPGTSGSPFVVRAQARVTVTPICGSLFGTVIGPYQVQAEATARYDCSTGSPSIIRVDQFVYP